MKSFNPFIIFSAEKDYRTQEENENATEAIKRYLARRGIDYASVLGSYKGVTENSVLIPNYPSNYEEALFLAKHFDQESILLVDVRGRTYLEYLDGSTDERAYIGQWTEVDADLGKKIFDAWTEVEGLGLFTTVRTSI